MKHFLTIKMIFCLVFTLIYSAIMGQNWDNSFGYNGVVKIDLNDRNTRGYHLVHCKDGSLIAGVNGDISQYGALFERSIYIYKIQANGNINTDFGNNGCIYIPGENNNNTSWLFSLAFSEIDQSVYALAKIEGQLKVFRFDTNGIIDSMYNGNGFVDNIQGFNRMLVQDDGKLLLLGTYVDNGQFSHKLKRLNNDGSIDMNFGVSGTVIQSIDNYEKSVIFSSKMQADKIVVVGKSYNGFGKGYATIVRYLQNGMLDSNFGNNGVRIEHIGEEGFAEYTDLDINTENEIIVAGKYIYSNGTGGFSGNKAILAKYSENGNLLPSFNGTGIKIFNSINSANDYFNSVSFLSDGNIIAGGSSGCPFPIMQSYYYLTKVSPSGEIDTDFFNNGYIVTDFGNASINSVHKVITVSDDIFSIGITSKEADHRFIAVICKMKNYPVQINSGQKYAVKIYPNPVNDYLNIVLPDNNYVKLSIFNTSGIKLYEKNISGNDKILMTKFPAGMYFIHLENQKARQTYSIVKQ